LTDIEVQPAPAAPVFPRGINGPGRLFVFEGIDCCGKDTQADLFTGYLRAWGRDVFRCNLPDRTGTYGKEIDAWLQPGRFTAYDPDVVKRLVGMLYQCDNVFSSQGIKRRLEQGQDVVLVRYILSSLVYQRGQYALIPLIRDNFLALMPWPDATVFIDIPAQESADRMHSRDPGKGPEFYEGDCEKMQRLRHRYTEALVEVERLGILRVYEDNFLSKNGRASDYLGHFVRIDGEAALYGRNMIHSTILARLGDAGIL